MADRDSLAASRFNCTVRERACYEAGIKMATIYHQFVGSPVNLSNVASLENSIADAIKVQPYVKDAVVKIDRSAFTENGDRYSYLSLTGDMIDAVVTIEIENVILTSEMRYDNVLGYPLMFISDIRES